MDKPWFLADIPGSLSLGQVTCDSGDSTEVLTRLAEALTFFETWFADRRMAVLSAVLHSVEQSKPNPPDLPPYP